jgi:hypothetical protein
VEGVLLQKNDTPPNESILLNQPLGSSDHWKLLIFSLLMVPSVVLLVGVLPAIFLWFGIYIMGKNKDFSSIDTAVLYIKRYILAFLVYAGLVFLDFLYTSLIHQIEYGSWFFQTQKFILSLLCVVIAIIYLTAVNTLFYSPLKKHSEWVAVNGIFSGKPKSDIKSATESEMDIIKAEKLKQYSVADELMKWGKLKEEGHISENEFNQVKAKLLKRN